MRRIVKPQQTSEKDIQGFYTKQASKVVTLDPNFPDQNKFVEDTSQFIIAQCSRRAGKSNGLALRFFRSMEKYPGSTCFYLALTKDSARDIMWPVITELNEKLKLGLILTESKLLVKHPNGSKLKLYGADMKNFVKRLKGQKSPGIAVDETQDFASHLQSLVDDVLTPMLADYADSWLALTGTPGPVPFGYFFDATQGGRYGYSIHRWTILENPYIPNAASFIEKLKEKREWQDNHPTLLREWRNTWVLDVEALWIQYKPDKNNFQTLPKLSGGNKYSYILGVDWGYKDSDALAVLAYSDESPVTYLVDEMVTPKQGITELVNQVQEMRARYDISKIVMDEGGGGKKMAEEMRRQHAIPVEPADKIRKQETVEFFNDALRTGKFKAKDSSRFAQDSYLVQIDWDKSTPDKIVIKKQPHSDIIDAVIYGFKCSPAYAYQPEKPKAKVGSKEWADEQQAQMFDAALDHFQEQQEREKKLWGNQD